jgi:hypothetical protein
MAEEKATTVKKTRATTKGTGVEVEPSVYQNRVVIIKAKEAESWAGFNRYPKCKDTIVAKQGRGGYNTGLTDAMQKQLEKDLFMEPGTLSPYSKYWVEYAVFVYDKELELNLNTPKDLLDYYVVLQSDRVANSVNELENWPKAEYVIFDAEEDAKKENTAVKARRRAFGKFSKMSSQEMIDVLKLSGKKASNMSVTMVENEIDKMIQDNPEEFNAILDLPGFKTRVLIQDLLSINAIRKNGTHYLVGEEPIGHDLESTVLYLEDPQNQSMLISLKSKLEASI